MADGLVSINREALINFLDGDPEQEGLGRQQSAFNNLIGEELALSVYQDYINSLNQQGKVVHGKVFVKNPAGGQNKWLDGYVTKQENIVNEIIEVKSWASSNYEGKLNAKGIPLTRAGAELMNSSIENARRSLCKWAMGFDNIEKILYTVDNNNASHDGLSFSDSMVRTVVFWQPIYLPQNLALQTVFDRAWVLQDNVAAKSLSIINADFRRGQRLKYREGREQYMPIYERCYQIFSVSNYLRNLQDDIINVRAPLYKGMTDVLGKIIPTNVAQKKKTAMSTLKMEMA